MNPSSSRDGRKCCFVIMKFGKKDTPDYEKQRSLYEDIIRPAVEESGLGYECLRADEIMRPSSIIKDIVDQLWQADVVIADLTDQNPNVFYELGVRHALRGRTIMLVQTMEDVPFDVRNYRVIEYDPFTPKGMRSVTLEIRNHLDELARQPTLVDSPVLDVLPAELKPIQESDGSQPSSRAEQEIRILRSSMEGLSRRFDTEVATRLEKMSQLTSSQVETMTQLSGLVSKLRPGVFDTIEADVDAIAGQLEKLTLARADTDANERFGLAGIHRTRLDAIEHAFYSIMDKETKQIDIVGSTIFGLRGHSWVTTARVLDLLRSKKLADDGFVIRILLTHFDYLSSRMDQERNVKTPDRYVISQESVKAIAELRSRDLLEQVKFYKGAPTCFSIVCHSQKQMLLNPYPYEREAYSSWTIVFREVPTGIYQDFLISHVENPWQNSLLTAAYSEEYEHKLKERANSDLKEFYESQQR